MGSKIICNLLILRFKKKNHKISGVFHSIWVMAEFHSIWVMASFEDVEYLHCHVFVSKTRVGGCRPWLVSELARIQRESRGCKCGNILLTTWCCVAEPQPCQILAAALLIYDKSYTPLSLDRQKAVKCTV